MREDDVTREAARRAEQRIAGGSYGPGTLDEVTVPQTDERRVLQATDTGDPAAVDIDPEVLRDGGPTRGQGAVTTTGGTAGPATTRRIARSPEKHAEVAPTTTGDATTGGMSTPAGGSTSDQSSEASQVGNFTDR